MNICKIFNRLLVLALAAAVLFTALLPVTAQAASDDNNWYDLLEVSSLTPQGENWISFSSNSTTFTVPVQGEKRFAKIDMIFWHQTAERITAASVSVGSTTTNLTCQYLGENISRVYGSIPNAFYEEIPVTITKSTSNKVTFELLSCRASAFTTMDFPCDAEFFIREDGAYVPCPGEYDYGGDDSVSTNEIQFPVIIYDWQKFDSITLTGSVLRVGLNSVRASIGQAGLDYQMTYTSTNSTGEYVIRNYRYSADLDYGGEDYTITGTETGVSQTYYNGKVLYNLTIDLSGVDRSSTLPLMIYFTGVSNGQYGYRVQVVGCTGSVSLPDTSNVSWFTRITSFLSTLFGGDDSEANDYKDEMQQQGAAADDYSSTLNDMDKPDAGDIDININQYIDSDASAAFGSIMSQFFDIQMILVPIMISFMAALAAFIIFGRR